MDSVRQVTPQMWKHFCDHVDKENDYWMIDELLEDTVEEFITQLNDSKSESKEEAVMENEE